MGMNRVYKYLNLFRIMKKISLILLLCIISNFIYSTPQKPDKIIYEGIEYSLRIYLFEEYFNNYPDKRPKTEYSFTNLHRGYFATYEIEDNKIILKDIQIYLFNKENDYSLKSKSVIKDIFPNNEKIVIDWFSGILELPCPRESKFKFFNKKKKTKYYLLIKVKDGLIQKEKKMIYKEYLTMKKGRFQNF